MAQTGLVRNHCQGACACRAGPPRWRKEDHDLSRDTSCCDLVYQRTRDAARNVCTRLEIGLKMCRVCRAALQKVRKGQHVRVGWHAKQAV